MKCKVCEFEINLNINDHYISRDDTETGLALLAKSKETTLYDTFDCPVCGCQNVIQERKRKFISEVVSDSFDEEEEEEKEVEVENGTENN